MKPLASLRSFQYFGVPVRKDSCGTPAPVSGPCRAILTTFLPKSMPVVVPSSPGPATGAAGAAVPVPPVVPPVVVPPVEPPEVLPPDVDPPEVDPPDVVPEDVDPPDDVDPPVLPPVVSLPPAAASAGVPASSGAVPSVVPASTGAPPRPLSTACPPVVPPAATGAAALRQLLLDLGLEAAGAGEQGARQQDEGQLLAGADLRGGRHGCAPGWDGTGRAGRRRGPAVVPCGGCRGGAGQAGRRGQTAQARPSESVRGAACADGAALLEGPAEPRGGAGAGADLGVAEHQADQGEQGARRRPSPARSRGRG